MTNPPENAFDRCGCACDCRYRWSDSDFEMCGHCMRWWLADSDKCTCESSVDEKPCVCGVPFKHYAPV